jgi:2-(1,2-epoxy-1,2-dihydrophenyl)acetyl-CoA isomerase
MNYQTILLEKENGILTLTLNRPDRLNALNEQMAEELIEALEAVDQDEEVRVLVITGAGRAFCSGADVRDRFLTLIEQRKRGEEKVVHLGGFAERCCLALRKLRQPVIASINGAAVGFGCTFALACDIRLASEEARMGMVFVRVGLTPEFGSTYFLPRLVGIAKACELVFSGKIIDAREAREIGLVNQVVPPEQLRAATYELAKSIAEGPPLAIQLAKRGLYQGLDNDLLTQLQFESFALNVCRATDDHEEGARAFLEKRKPVFKGR